MSKDTEIRDSFIAGGCVVAWAVIWMWASFFIWTYLPTPRDHWWGFPAIMTNVVMLPMPFFVAAALDWIFGWSD